MGQCHMLLNDSHCSSAADTGQATNHGTDDIANGVLVSWLLHTKHQIAQTVSPIEGVGTKLKIEHHENPRVLIKCLVSITDWKGQVKAMENAMCDDEVGPSKHTHCWWEHRAAETLAACYKISTTATQQMQLRICLGEVKTHTTSMLLCGCS